MARRTRADHVLRSVLTTVLLALPVVAVGGDRVVSVKAWNAVSNGDFESGAASWTASSTYGSDVIRSGIRAHQGNGYVLLGDAAPVSGNAGVVQEIILGDTGADLSFYLKIPLSSGNGLDELHVIVDGTTLLSINEESSGYRLLYQQVVVSLASYADGGPHLLELSAQHTDTGTLTGTEFLIDDVAVQTSGEVVQAEFSWDPPGPVAGEEVQLTDYSSGSPTGWLWEFPDLSSSTVQNPLKVFPSPGEKPVTLHVVNSQGVSSAITHYIPIAEPPVAAFEWTPVQVTVGDSVQFLDLSTGTPDTWSWGFDDTTTSDQQNPVHVFTEARTYSISLTVGLLHSSYTSITVLPLDVSAAPLVTADFSWTPQPARIGIPVQFSDQSLGEVTQWSWNFDDGTTSDLQHPVHEFAAAGFYQVNLSVTGTGSDTYNVTKEVEVLPELAADFGWSPESPVAGAEVSFLDQSQGGPQSWLWDFGDGAESTEMAPVHVYADPGSYQVSLTVTGGDNTLVSSITKTLTVQIGVVADFDWWPLSPATGEEVYFVDQSQGGVMQWSWQLGDGTVSQEPSPIHTYTVAGTFPVRLTVTAADPNIQDVKLKTVTVRQGLAAEFSWSPQQPNAGEEVQFADRSSGNPNGWKWRFDDGTTSTLRNPLHAFTEARTYNVTLTVENFKSDSAKDQASVTYPVEVAPALVARFSWRPEVPRVGDKVQLLDQSLGNPTGWLWDFGDGESSALQNPVHTFTHDGVFNVSLTVSDADGSTSPATNMSVVVLSGLLEPSFSWSPETPIAGQVVSFTDSSIGDPEWWLWRFGDGASSGEPNPQHTYARPGKYEVTLTISRAGAKAVASVSQVVKVREELFADFVWQPETPRPGQSVQLSDRSVGAPSRWTWHLGDGTRSTAQNPTHSYAAAGSYLVTLTVGKGTARSSVNRTIVVAEQQVVDFSWSPEQPVAGQEVQLSDRSEGSFSSYLWLLGDGSISDVQHPRHTYSEPGSYGVTLIVTDDSGLTGRREKSILVRPPPYRLGLAVSESRPDIGQTVLFVITGIDAVESVHWSFGGPGCGGAEKQATCVAGTDGGCLEMAYRYATRGVKVAKAVVTIDGVEQAPLVRDLVVGSAGSCGEPPVAAMTWWPLIARAGDSIRFSDLSSGPPGSWRWIFGDGAVSTLQHPDHSFTEPGSYPVKLMVSNLEGESEAIKTIEVLAGTASCGDGVCDESEGVWSCPADCGFPEDATGRPGAAGSDLFVPAVVGGVSGVSDTFWLTEGMVFNPGEEPISLVLELRPDDKSDSVLSAGPLMLDAERAVAFENLVAELFGVTSGGSLRLDADGPLLLDTRTFNLGDTGTFGQAIGAVERRRAVAEGDGKVYLVGLSESEEFRSNLIFQEVSGEPVTAVVEIFANNGTRLGGTQLPIAGYGRELRRLDRLGVRALPRGYATVETRQTGRLVVIASVIDAVTGDATTVDPVHREQTKGPEKAVDGEIEHLLVAVVARAAGENNTLWRSELSMQNPFDGNQQVELIYYPTAGGSMTAKMLLEARHQYFSDDVVSELFPAAADGNGSLHVYSDSGVIVGSRTYNQQPDGATLGQYLPGLGAGDMVVPGQVWILNKLKATGEFRCNIGFSEYSGSDAQVTVVLFDMSGGAKRYLGSKSYPVSAFGFTQVNQVFSDIGLSGQYDEALAYVIVSSDDGAVYAYASIIDNNEGDATTVLAKYRDD